MSDLSKKKGKDTAIREDNAETTDGQEETHPEEKEASSDSELEAKLQELLKRKAARMKGKEKAKEAAGTAQVSAPGPGRGKKDPKVADPDWKSGPTKPAGKGKSAAKAKAPKAPKVTVKVEDLDLDKVNLMTPDQVELDAAIIGFVRVRIVNPDPTETHEWKVVNEREINKAHLASIKQSLKQRKVDWEHPMIALVNGVHIDPACISASPVPMKDLKEIAWTCPTAQRRIDFLSGNHRQEAVKDLYVELVEKESDYQWQLELHQAAQASGGQAELNMQGELVDTLGTRLAEQIKALGLAQEEMVLWTTTLYDEGNLKHKPALVAQLASNEARPARAEDVQERAQIMFWKLEAQMGRWLEEHEGLGRSANASEASPVSPYKWLIRVRVMSPPWSGQG
ncbi:hypothetical protein LXA43DRAFT_1097712 [Ganoderma leucocontextum]|nr:hypothetical protein LXA43DRAFT_1097712 [Ganoderma leucocontextum]